MLFSAKLLSILDLESRAPIYPVLHFG